MKPLRRAFVSSLLSVAFAATVFAQPERQGPVSGAAAPQVAPTPQAIGAMANAVSAFFNPANSNPSPTNLDVVLLALQQVGTAAGPSREQMQPVIDRIGSAATRFDGFDPLEPAPAYGLAASVQLEFLAGPLRAWLSNEQKDLILKKQAEYGAKLSAADRGRLSAKMKAMAEALAAGAASSDALEPLSVRAGPAGEPSAEKASLWREHGSLSAPAVHRGIDGHDVFGDAADFFSRPDVTFVARPPARSGGFLAALRRFVEKAGAAAYLSGYVTPEGLQAARSVLELDAPAQAAAAGPSRPVSGIKAFAQQLDDDYFNAHGFYPPGVKRQRADVSLAQPVAAPMPVAIAPAQARAALAGPNRDFELDDFIQRMDEDYDNSHGFNPGEGPRFSLRARDLMHFLVKASPVLALALMGGLLLTPHGALVLVILTDIAGGVLMVLLARRLGLKSVIDMKPGWQAWLLRGFAIVMDLTGGIMILGTLAAAAGLVLH